MTGADSDSKGMQTLRHISCGGWTESPPVGTQIASDQLLSNVSLSRAPTPAQRGRITATNVASTMLIMIANNPLLPLANTSSLRVLSCGGSPQSWRGRWPRWAVISSCRTA